MFFCDFFIYLVHISAIFFCAADVCAYAEETPGF